MVEAGQLLISFNINFRSASGQLWRTLFLLLLCCRGSEGGANRKQATHFLNIDISTAKNKAQKKVTNT